MGDIWTALTVGVVVPITLFFLYRLFWYCRLRSMVTVNCWFCNGDSRVPYANQNKWLCALCEQYNGFTDAGDYNRDLPEMRNERYNPPIRPQVRVKRESRPDVCGEPTMSVLCKTCNDNQMLKVRQLANFVPTNEENYDGEVEVFSERMERLYKLCKQCDERVTDALAYQRQLYFGTPNGPGSVEHRLYNRGARSASVARSVPTVADSVYMDAASTVLNTDTQSYFTTPMQHHRQRQNRPHSHNISPSMFSRICQVLCTTVVLLLWLADVNALQTDSGVEMISLSANVPRFILVAADACFRYSTLAHIVCLVVQLVFISRSNTRVVLADVMLLVLLPLVLAAHAKSVAPTLLSDQDRHIITLGLCTITLLLSFAAMVLPRRSIRSKKSKFSGCLSIASTPPSQCDSQLNTSDFESDVMSTMTRTSRPMSAASKLRPPRPLVRQVPSSQSQRPRQLRHTRRTEEVESMDCEIVGEVEGGGSKDPTPNRELAPKMDLLSLGARRRSPRQRQANTNYTVGHMQLRSNGQPKPTRSLFGGTKSMFTTMSTNDDWLSSLPQNTKAKTVAARSEALFTNTSSSSSDSDITSITRTAERVQKNRRMARKISDRDVDSSTCVVS